MAVTKHPSSQQRFKRLSGRFLKLRKEHEAAVNRMWAGALATNFTDEELALLSDYLCPADHALMRNVRGGSSSIEAAPFRLLGRREK